MNHGTLTAYCSHACRCPDCSRAASRHVKAWRLRRLQGEEPLVDAQPVRDHVQALLDAGMSFRGIALTAGWKSRNSLTSALSRDRVLVRTRDRIMAIRPESDMRRHGYVDSTGSRRRLQALMAIGWPSRVLAERIGFFEHGSVLDLTADHNRTIRRATADTIKALFDELWDQPGPSRISAQRAAKRGWAPPLAWDDDTICDPAAVAHGERWNRSRDRRALVEDFAEMRAAGTTFANAAMRLDMTETALDRALHRARKDGFEVPDFGKENVA